MRSISFDGKLFAENEGGARVYTTNAPHKRGVLVSNEDGVFNTDVL